MFFQASFTSNYNHSSWQRTLFVLYPNKTEHHLNLSSKFQSPQIKYFRNTSTFDIFSFLTILRDVFILEVYNYRNETGWLKCNPGKKWKALGEIEGSVSLCLGRKAWSLQCLKQSYCCSSEARSKRAMAWWWQKPEYITLKYASLTQKLFWAEGNKETATPTPKPPPLAKMQDIYMTFLTLLQYNWQYTTCWLCKFSLYWRQTQPRDSTRGIPRNLTPGVSSYIYTFPQPVALRSLKLLSFALSFL